MRGGAGQLRNKMTPLQPTARPPGEPWGQAQASSAPPSPWPDPNFRPEMQRGPQTRGARRRAAGSAPLVLPHRGPMPAPLLAEPQQHGHQLSSAPNAAPRMEARLPTHEDVGGQGHHGEWLESWVTLAPRVEKRRCLWFPSHAGRGHSKGTEPEGPWIPTSACHEDTMRLHLRWTQPMQWDGPV